VLAGEVFVARVCTDKGAFRSWCSTCTALCEVAGYQLKALFELATGTTGQASQQIGAMQTAPQGSNQQVQLPQLSQHGQPMCTTPHGTAQQPTPHEQPSLPHHQPAGTQAPQPVNPSGAPLVQTLTHLAQCLQSALATSLHSPEVTALLPVMGAAALKLAHAAYACVRLTSRRVITGRSS
jgi:hypothetical protein